MAFNVGDNVGDYQIIGILGAGGMGKVYKVRNTISDRVEAMKVLLPDLATESELADRFIREIKLLASLNHPNIAALHTALRLDNQLLMIMEFVEGRTLEDRLKEGPVPAHEAVGYICQALSALGFAHERGVVHRDIKPANMMVTAAGELKLMDFGIAKAVADRRLTMTGTTLGSLYYMSPEQVKGSGDLDGRSDIYSVGVSLYELVTGSRPFKGDSDYSIMVAHLEQKPVPPIEVAPGVPPMLNEVIMAAIEKDPASRFQTAQAFRAALESVAGSLGVAVPQAPVRTAAPVAAQPTVTAMQSAQPQPAPPPAAPSMPPAAAAPRSGHRGLWMALGAVVAVAVLAVAAIQLPRWYRTRAGAAPASEQTPAAAETAAPSTSPEAPQTPAAAETAAPAVVETAPAAAAIAVPTPPAAPSRTASRGSRAVAAPSGGSASFEPASSPAPAQYEPPAAPQAQAAPAAPAPDTAALEELRDRMGSLGPRANALRSSLQNLEREQRAQGVGLRTDISASWKRMEYLLDEAEAALRANDATRAKRNLDLAEREADRLDRFLGH